MVEELEKRIDRLEQVVAKLLEANTKLNNRIEFLEGQLVSNPMAGLLGDAFKKLGETLSSVSVKTDCQVEFTDTPNDDNLRAVFSGSVNEKDTIFGWTVTGKTNNVETNITTAKMPHEFLQMVANLLKSIDSPKPGDVRYINIYMTKGF